ncbi:MAG: hypothetical protein OXB88_01885 [Bacteriovoracales bacterium]|nr:hypothetical protein [Bacteriovoracales bacterium]
MKKGLGRGKKRSPKNIPSKNEFCVRLSIPHTFFAVIAASFKFVHGAPLLSYPIPTPDRGVLEWAGSLEYQIAAPFAPFCLRLLRIISVQKDRGDRGLGNLRRSR